MLSLENRRVVERSLTGFLAFDGADGDPFEMMRCLQRFCANKLGYFDESNIKNSPICSCFTISKPGADCGA